MQKSAKRVESKITSYDIWRVKKFLYIYIYLYIWSPTLCLYLWDLIITNSNIPLLPNYFIRPCKNDTESKRFSALSSRCTEKKVPETTRATRAGEKKKTTKRREKRRTGVKRKNNYIAAERIRRDRPWAPCEIIITLHDPRHNVV